MIEAISHVTLVQKIFQTLQWMTGMNDLLVLLWFLSTVATALMVSINNFLSGSHGT
jgi:hypothetical protein